MMENPGDKSKKIRRRVKNLREESKKIGRRVKNMEIDHPPTYLPNDLVIENILTRVPTKLLLRCAAACKPWYNSIHCDPRFASSHFVQSQKNPNLVFSFPTVDRGQGIFSSFLYYLDRDRLEDDEEGECFPQRIGCITSEGESELIGYCNGLFSLTAMGPWPSFIHIFNPNRSETLCVFRPIFDGEIVCHGFGFDSFTNEYKVVLIFLTVEAEYKCLVFSLGTSFSWRETTIPPPSPHETFHRKPYSKSALFCGGALFWRTREPNNILLSFDLHDETFKVIQLPAQCVLTEEQENEKPQKVHLLEFKGSLCVAHVEKILGGHDEDPNSSCKVHLHILKDRVKLVWVKETFDLRSSLSPQATRIVSFSDRVILAWYNGEFLQLYDLHTRQLTVVMPYLPIWQHIFEKKHPSDGQEHPTDDQEHPADDNVEAEMEYQLHSYVENFRSLKTFVPEGARRIDYDGLGDFMDGNPRSPGGFLFQSTSLDAYLF